MNRLFRSCVVLVCLLVPALAFAQQNCTPAPPAIDGVIGEWEWNSARTIDVDVNVPEGGTTPGRLYIMNDDKFLYVALRLYRPKADPGYIFQTTLDANYDRSRSAGDDVFTVSLQSGWYSVPIDGVYFVCGKTICHDSDTLFGGNNDVAGRASADGTYVMFEASKPLVSLDGNDANMEPGSLIGMTFQLSIFSNRVGGMNYPANPWEYFDYVIDECIYWH